MKTIEAFQVHSPCREHGIIVFAESHNQAKSAVAGLEVVDTCEYHELKCQRIPEADKYATETPSVLWWELPGSEKIYHEMGWHLHDEPSCDRCGVGQFASIRESEVRELEDGEEVCRGCLGEEEWMERQGR